jgi:hypothetical protein
MGESTAQPNEFNLNELYRKAFGYRGVPLPIAFLPQKEKNPVADDFPEVTGLDPNITKLRGNFDTSTQLGAPLRMPMKIGIPGKTPIQLPNEPIVSLDMDVDLKKTMVNRGRNQKRGTVKEVAGLGDYTITIKGIIYRFSDNDFPEEDLRAIRTILENVLITVECFYTSMFNISLATVTKARWPRDEEMSFREQDYEINLLSDEDFELELI